MKKIIIAVFIVIATLGIAAGTTAKKAPVKTTTKKSTSTPKNEVTDPYVGWWYHESDENIYVDDQDTINYITKKNQKYFIKVYQFTSFKKEKGIGLCKNRNGIKSEIKNITEKFEDYKYKKVTEEQLEVLKYNMENAEWISQKDCENAN